MKALWAGEAADVDGCGMRTSVRRKLERGIVPERTAVGKEEVKSGSPALTGMRCSTNRRKKVEGEEIF
jgi:hypothetical protein